MATRKLNVLLAIPEPLTFDQEIVWQAAIKALAKLKAISKRINAGKANEEMTVVAKWHKCYHDEGIGAPKCEPDKEI